MRRINFLGLGLLVVFPMLIAPLQSSFADELSVAKTKLQELQKSIDLENKYLNVDYPKNVDLTNQCIVKFTNAQDPDDQTKHSLCVTELERLQLDRERRLTQLSINSAEINKLTVEIDKLESSTRTSAGAATNNPGGGAVAPTPTVTPNETPAPSTSSLAAVSPTASTPTPKVASTIKSPTPSASPAPSRVQKVTATPKPVMRKKTITCGKGKTVRKVTAVKPVCPKGFKVQKTK